VNIGMCLKEEEKDCVVIQPEKPLKKWKDCIISPVLIYTKM